MFLAAAGGLVALVLVVMLPGVWRGVLREGGTPGTRRRSLLVAAALALGVPAVAIALYALRGEPGALDDERGVLSTALLQSGLPPPGEGAEQLYAELQQHLGKHPDDPRALVLKARMDMRADRFDAAVLAFRGALSGKSKAVNDAGIWVEYAEALGMAQGGKLQGAPLQMVEKALAIDARHVQALDLAGSAAWEVRDFAKAAMYWKRLLERIPAGEPRHAELSMAISRAEKQARLSLPASN